MIPWVGKVIIVVQFYFCGNIIPKESSVQYSFGQMRTLHLIEVVDMLLVMLKCISSLGHLFVQL
jgi:hypothetical protein